MIAVRRTLYFAPEATTALRHIDRARVARVRNVIRQLTETPEALDYWPHPRDPSVYGVSVDEQITVWFEILDEQHAIRVLTIEQ